MPECHPSIDAQRPVRRRILLAALLLTMMIGATAVASACDPVSESWAWTAGHTHGAIIETTAGRASLAIYRVPSRGLFVVYKKNDSSIRSVQDVLWALGKPPALRKTFTFHGRSLTVEFGAGTTALRAITKRLIYDSPDDLHGALVDAHAHNSCLALTLISYGRPTSNWTQKQTDCKEGSIP